MENEILARAITGIDDALLEDAAPAAKAAKSAGWKRWAAAAACLALVVSALALARLSGANVQIRLNGEKLGRQPLPVTDAAQPRTARAPEAEDELTVCLELKAGRETPVSVSVGVIRVFDGEELIYEGSSFTCEKDVTIQWRIKQLPASKAGEMNAGGRVLLLEYDSGLDCWTIHEK